MKRKISAIFLTAILSLISAFSISAAPTATQVLAKTAALINKAGSLSCAFTISVQGKAIKGNMKSSGSKFAVTTSASSSWYNGKNMWIHNPSTGETTLVTPTAAELAEVNPLVYVNGYSSSFTAALSKTAKAGTYDVVLTPKKKNSGIKSVTLTINSSNWYPVKVLIRPSSGKAVTLTVSNLKFGTKFAASEFEYPKKRYPKAEIIDLR